MIRLTYLVNLVMAPDDRGAPESRDHFYKQGLTHLPLDKMTAIWQSIISDAFSKNITFYFFDYNCTEICS